MGQSGFGAGSNARNGPRKCPHPKRRASGQVDATFSPLALARSIQGSRTIVLEPMHQVFRRFKNNEMKMPINAAPTTDRRIMTNKLLFLGLSRSSELFISFAVSEVSSFRVSELLDSWLDGSIDVASVVGITVVSGITVLVEVGAGAAVDVDAADDIGAGATVVGAADEVGAGADVGVGAADGVGVEAAVNVGAGTKVGVRDAFVLKVVKYADLPD